MQNIVLLMDPSDEACDISLNAGNMLLNRFCIGEDAAFESAGVYNLCSKTCSSDDYCVNDTMDFPFLPKAKGQRKYCDKGFDATMIFRVAINKHPSRKNFSIKRLFSATLLILHLQKLPKINQKTWKYTLFILAVFITSMNSDRLFSKQWRYIE